MPRRFVLVGVVATLGIAAVAVFWFRPRPEPPPPAVRSAPLPPLTESSFLNTKDGVAFAGDASCADCHPTQDESYHGHPMGRSLFAAAAAPAIEKFDAAADNPFRDGPFRFEVVRRGGRLVHREWCQDDKGTVVAEREEPVAFAVGSGAHARAYLYEREGFLFQSPLTWYTGKGHWALAPGYEIEQGHLNRRIDARCLFCHSQEARPVEHTVNRYRDPPFGQLAIGCERCHGPGALHVAARRLAPPTPNEPDRTIVNPSHLAPALRESVCEQCHLQGEAIVVRRGRQQTDYRPGLPLADYVSVFVRRADDLDVGKIVGHAEQMRQSACYQKGGGALGCVSCHDPHRLPKPEERVAFYRKRCLDCHAEPAAATPRKTPPCSLPLEERKKQQPADDCAACHLPRSPSTNVTHLALTDHRVPRRSGAVPKPPAEPGDMPLIAFHGRRDGASEDERSRDLGIALISLAMRAEAFGQKPIRDYLVRRARPPLEEATRRAPDDLPALEAHAFALYAAGQLDEALALFADALKQAPEREETLAWASRVAEARGRLDLAEEYALRLTTAYPHFADHFHRLASVRLKREAWLSALEPARTAVRLHPFRAETRALLVTALLETGDRAGAQAEFDALGTLDPPYQERIRAWFQERLRATGGAR